VVFDDGAPIKNNVRNGAGRQVIDVHSHIELYHDSSLPLVVVVAVVVGSAVAPSFVSVVLCCSVCVCCVLFFLVLLI
jgi:hypothetical protein